MSNAEILTLEQVALIRQDALTASIKHIEQLCDSHQKLQAQLAVAIENWQAQAEHDVERLADAQADLLALAVLLTALVEGEAQVEDSPISAWDLLSTTFNIQVTEALTRPDVRRLLAAAARGS